MNTNLHDIVLQSWIKIMIKVIEPLDNFFENGLTSYQSLLFLIEINQSLALTDDYKHIEVSPEDIYREQTINNLVDCIIKQLSNKEIIYPLHVKENVEKNILCLPPLMGFSHVFKSLSKKLDCNVYGIDYSEADNILDIANILSKEIVNNERKYEFILGYSFGGLIAFELTKILEALNLKVTLIIVDSAPDANFDFQVTNEIITAEAEKWNVNINDIAERLDLIIEKISNRLRTNINYKPMGYIKSDIILFISTENTFQNTMMNQWKKLTRANVECLEIDANHYNIIEHELVQLQLNDLLK